MSSGLPDPILPNRNETRNQQRAFAQEIARLAQQRRRVNRAQAPAARRRIFVRRRVTPPPKVVVKPAGQALPPPKAKAAPKTPKAQGIPAPKVPKPKGLPQPPGTQTLVRKIPKGAVSVGSSGATSGTGGTTGGGAGGGNVPPNSPPNQPPPKKPTGGIGPQNIRIQRGLGNMQNALVPQPPAQPPAKIPPIVVNVQQPPQNKSANVAKAAADAVQKAQPPPQRGATGGVGGINRSIVVAVVVIGGAGILHAQLTKQPMTPVVIGSLLLLVFLSLFDLFGGVMSAIAGGIAMLAMIAVLLVDLPGIISALGQAQTSATQKVAA